MKHQWLKARCPICGKEYDYRDDYKPVTCGKFDCLKAANDRQLFQRKIDTRAFNL